MIKLLLSLIAASSTGLCFLWPDFISSLKDQYHQLPSIVIMKPQFQKRPTGPYALVSEQLQQQAPGMNQGVIDKVVASLQCADEHHMNHNNILTIIDYSLPSSEKRLWVYNLTEHKLLYNTYVSHGIRSGQLITNNFSNKFDSKASSFGVYETQQTYYGRDGLSLRLNGLERGFNDNASNRYIVMHGGWYVEEQFIKRYGRAGRSWGCPALPLNMTQSIINTIKDKSIFVAYYPSDEWFEKSRFLNCASLEKSESFANFQINTLPATAQTEEPEEILYVDLNKNNRREENEPVVVISADSYQRLFNTNVPLTRMLRRQINNSEYIALNKTEFNVLATNKYGLNEINFVIPDVKMDRGYYITLMKILPFGKIQDIRLNGSTEIGAVPSRSYTVYFDKHPFVDLKSTHQFIRWLGL